MAGFDVEYDAEKLLENLEILPDKLQTSLAAAITRKTIDLQSHIVKDKLSGDPLNRRSGDLSDSIAVEDVVSGAQMVSGGVGTNKAYAPVHEFGETVEKKSKKGKSFTQKYPKRSFMQSSYDEMKPEIISAMNDAIKEGLS